MCKQGFKVDTHNNNEAEYSILEVGLQICIKHGVRWLCIKGDSLLVVKQVFDLKVNSLVSTCAGVKLNTNTLLD